MATYEKVLFTLSFDGDWSSFTKAMLDELGALVDRGAAASAVLDAPVDGDELELVERLTKGGVVTEINTVSVFEFDVGDKIRHLDIYQQREP